MRMIKWSIPNLPVYNLLKGKQLSGLLIMLHKTVNSKVYNYHIGFSFHKGFQF